MFKFKFELVPEKNTIEPYIKAEWHIPKDKILNWIKDITTNFVNENELCSDNSICSYSFKVSYRKESLVLFLNMFNNDIATLLINDLMYLKKRNLKFGKLNYLFKKILS